MFTISQIAETVNGKIDGNPDLVAVGSGASSLQLRKLSSNSKLRLDEGAVGVDCSTSACHGTEAIDDTVRDNLLGVGHDEDDDVHVQSAEIGVLVPLDARECSPCEEEVSLRWFHRFQGFILASPRKFWEETHRECKSTLVPRLEIG